MFQRSVNIQKFKEYLVRLREENGDDKICIFMDNLGVHKSNKTRKTMQTLKMKAIFNISYSPQYNPIESVFSKVKQKFKCMRLQKLMG